jgi:1-acyl-sn-glycerol-3-phosphate acyltransferase
LKKFFNIPNEKILEGLENLDRDQLLYRVMPDFLMEIMSRYFRLTLEGEEHLPKKGRVLITPNHSGYSGFDAMILSHVLKKITGRAARVLTHHLWFLTETTSLPAAKLGFVEATRENGVKYLKKNQQVVIFPEGENGNFKPSTKAYHLQEFKRGFIRMALITQSPIVPTLIVGAEETHINLKKLKLTKFLRGLVLPLPLNVIPLPAKWKIIFLEPIHLPFPPSSADDREVVHELAQMVREKMQTALRKELKERKSVFIG